ncbi:CST complex subunit STN1 [Rhodamnia argentea]|uniref:CST complex subunit STN1 n=1 Tax=Rhodamnia argentea TaxID=178133 RepID=A0A8B8P4E4_9MYRT|nr:CST complex subunit STN1 [Rhodamnia argentea]
MDKSLFLVHVKLLAFDLLSLAQSPTNPPTFSLDHRFSISRAEALGVVVSREHKPGRFLKFAVDDGTGCVPCVLWLNHATSPYFARQRPQGVRQIAEVANGQASLVKLGSVARVRGRITSYRGEVQITVSRVVVERDPNAEVLHWLDCLKLARRVYGKPTTMRNTLHGLCPMDKMT